MPKSLINFVHANGFPASSYQTLFDYLPDTYQIIALEKYGHNELFPVQDNWQPQVDELIQFVKQQLSVHQQQKVISVGHSFGGIIAFLAACQQPQLFAGVVMLDSPVLTGSRAFFTKYIKKTQLIDKFSPAGKSKVRRTHWPLATDLESLFARRSLFKNFDRRCLADYVKHGITTDNNTLTLTFNAQVETEIFRHLPENLSHYKNKLQIPTTFVYAQDAAVFPVSYFKKFAKLNKIIKLISAPGSHMFPLEHPKETAQLLSKILSDL